MIWKPILASAIFYSAEFDLLLGVLISMIYVSTFLSRVLIFPGTFHLPCTIGNSLLLIVCGSLEQSTVLQYENSDKERG